MTILYSPSTGGFYRSDAHAAASIPGDATEITDQLYQQLMADRDAGKAIIWDPNAYVPGSVVPIITLVHRQALKNTEIDTAVAAAIIAGFTSAALGSDHLYASAETDQLNLIGAVVVGANMTYPCRNGAGVWDRRLHTAAQLQQVLTAGANRKQALLVHADTLRAQVAATIDLPGLDAITIDFSGV